MTNHSHPSSSWTTYLHTDGPSTPAHPDAFLRAMHWDRFPRAVEYDPIWLHRSHMGPNSIWLMEDLAEHLALGPGMRILDLGCGSAVTSIFLAREFGVSVWAADLWIDPSSNWRRIVEADVADRVVPIACEAHVIPFAHGFFDGIVSVDAFHYFGTEVRYLSYLAQFVRPGGFIAMTSPGNSTDPSEALDAASTPMEQFGADWFTFRSPQWWIRHWGGTRGVEVESAEMIDDGWDLWYRSHEASAAWSGYDVDESGDTPLLKSEAGRTLGFVRAIARRTDGLTLMFGPGRYASRIA